MHGSQSPSLVWQGALAFGLLSAQGTCYGQSPVTTPPAQVELGLNVPIERSLAGGQTDTFRVPCGSGDFLRIVAEQNGIDLAVSITGPDGKTLVTADGPNGSFGPEPASAICPATGSYSIRIISGDPGALPGTYAVRLDALHLPDANDRLQIEAQQAAFAGADLMGGDKSQRQRSADLMTRAIGDWTQLGDKYEACIWTNTLGQIEDALGEKQKALDAYNQSLALARGLNNQVYVATSLGNLGLVYASLGQNQTALDYYLQALPIAHAYTHMGEEAATLSNIGMVYNSLGEKQKALDYYQRTLALQRGTNNPNGVATTTSNIGHVYASLDQNEKALGYFEQVLPAVREAKQPIEEGLTLVNIGVMLSHLGDDVKAIDSFNQALVILRKVGNGNGEAIALNNIGVSYQSLHQPQKALEYYRLALVLERRLGDRGGESLTLWRVGEVTSRLGDASTALRDELAALSLAEAVGDPDTQGSIDAALMDHFRAQQRPQVAIFFGTGAVNAYQQIRQNISGLDKDLQASFAKSKSSTYRELAELLVSVDRLGEAEHVLDLLKDAELKEAVRGGSDSSSAKTDLLQPADADRASAASIDSEASRAAELTSDSFEFDRLNALTAPTPADKVQMQEISARIAAGNAAMEMFFNKTLYAELGNNSAANARVNDASTETSSLMNILADLGPGVIALYTLVGDQHSYIIVTTANTRVRHEVHADAAQLGKLVLAVRQQLVAPMTNPSANLNKLDHLLLDPIAGDIAVAAKQSKDGVPTLLWSLDGVLRYVPMSALYDDTQPAGKRYLVERARNVLITPESRNHLLDMPSTTGLTAVALGLSKSYSGAPELSGVTAELNAVVRDPAVAESHGPLSGKLVPDDAFTLLQFEDSLHQHYPVVHVASHFMFRSGSAGESYLLLSGDQTGGPGYALTLSQLQTDPKLSFRGTRLLTLSACATGEAGTASNGREIDSLGMVVQKRDAASVLATLWSVNDASTSLLMSDFYRRWATGRGLEKIEALRQAQVAMLRDNANESYHHPYFWAPFVLIGNFR